MSSRTCTLLSPRFFFHFFPNAYLFKSKFISNSEQWRLISFLGLTFKLKKAIFDLLWKRQSGMENSSSFSHHWPSFFNRLMIIDWSCYTDSFSFSFSFSSFHSDWFGKNFVFVCFGVWWQIVIPMIEMLSVFYYCIYISPSLLNRKTFFLKHTCITRSCREKNEKKNQHWFTTQNAYIIVSIRKSRWLFIFLLYVTHTYIALSDRPLLWTWRAYTRHT